LTTPPDGGLDERFAALAAGLPPIVCFANDWGGDPTSKHHIMRIFGRHVPVLWVESAGMRLPRLYHPADLRRIATRISRAARTRNQPSQASASAAGEHSAPAAAAGQPGVCVISPLSIPLPGNPMARAVNRRIYAAAVARALPAGSPPPLLWVYTPTVAPYLDAIPHSGVVYHCVDRWWAFTEYDDRVMRECHASLCERADHVFASAAELLNDCLVHTPRAELLPHGVDWAHFSTAALAPPAPPPDIADITGPVIGFFGLLADWIDQDLIIAAARSRPAATVVLIGKSTTDISRLLAEPNVRWLRQKPYAELPAYAAAFDVAMVPFVRNALTAAVNPIKLLEYMSAGVPVVATALPEIVRFGERDGLVTAAVDAEFVEAIGRYVDAPPTLASRQARARACREDSWLGRCIRIAGFLQPRPPVHEATTR
jgi:glycosyltransferase involved in cell wall biosynthesis